MSAVIPCPLCGGTMSLRPSKFGKGQMWYACTNWPRCDATIGTHPDGRPLGVVADSATRSARVEAHFAFDALWRSGQMSRKAAYRWMQESMGLPESEAHIAMFDGAQCRRLVNLVASRPPVTPPEGP